MNLKDVKAIEEILKNIPMYINHDLKKGGFVFKLNYFYRRDKGSEKFGEFIGKQIEALGLSPVIVSTTDNHSEWPEHNYYEAVFKFKQGGVR